MPSKNDRNDTIPFKRRKSLGKLFRYDLTTKQMYWLNHYLWQLPVKKKLQASEPSFPRRYRSVFFILITSYKRITNHSDHLNVLQVIVERYHKEKSLPNLDKTKFLVPQELNMSQFVTIIRNRLRITATQAFYLIVNNKSMASMSKTVAEVYRENRDEDGFLYVTYASQEMFGNKL